MYIIIGGGGEIGYYLTKNLLIQGHEVLLLEKGSARYQALNDELGPGRTIARLNNPKHEEIFQKLGIDLTVSPTRAILSLIESDLPSTRFVPLMMLKNAGLEIVEMRIPEKSAIVGKMLRDINLPRSSNLALIIRDKQFITPTAETQINAHDDVFALVNSEGEEELRKTFGALD